jgi:transcriptional regulator with GAF, ATPase, and Fis domain
MLSHRSTLLRRIIETPGDTVPQRICNLSAATNMDGVAILLNTDHRLVGTVASAGKVGQILAELELSLGEGPAHQAIAERAMVSADQLLFGSRDRWPVFAEHAVGAGIEAVFALPLQLGSIMVGVIEFARAMPGSLDSRELIDLANLSSLATSALLLTQARAKRQRDTRPTASQRTNSVTNPSGHRNGVPTSRGVPCRWPRSHACVFARTWGILVGDSTEDRCSGIANG